MVQPKTEEPGFAGIPGICAMFGMLLFSGLPAYFILVGGVPTSTRYLLENHGPPFSTDPTTWWIGWVAITLALVGIGVTILSVFVGLAGAAMNAKWARSEGRVKRVGMACALTLVAVWGAFILIILLSVVHRIFR